jgi:hypothetical protein
MKVLCTGQELNGKAFVTNNKKRLKMKRLKNTLSAVFGLCSMMALASTVNDARPDLAISQVVTVDHVGDITGDAALVEVLVKDSSGNPLGGVAVHLQSTDSRVVFTTVVGRTDKEGRLRSSLLSNRIGMFRVKAYVDMDGDGKVDAPIEAESELISFIDDLEFSNGVGINIDDPDDSAVLHVFSTERGVMIPRVALLGCSDKLTIVDPALSLLVFNTNASDTLDVGYVYFDGQDWKNFVFGQ